MVKFVLFIIVKLFLMVSSSSQAPKFIYVQPEASPSAECPVEECHNLSVLANNDLLIGDASNITIALLPGIHTYSSSKRVIDISNAMAIELVAMDQRIGSTVVSCNKSNSVGIALSHITNVSVRGITFEHCGVREGFTLSISYSNIVTIQHLTLRYCAGIALKIENLKKSLNFTNSAFIHNQANMYIYTPNADNETSNENKLIAIDNSLFMSGNYSGNNSLLPEVTNPGITMVLNQTGSYAVVTFIDVRIRVFPQELFSTGYCQIYSNMHTTSIHIERLHCHTDNVEAVHYLLYGYRAISGLNIDPRNYTMYLPSQRIGSITIANSYFYNSRVQIGPVLRSSTEFHLTLENVTIQHTLDPLTIVNTGNITLSNITVADSYGVMCISKCKHLSIYNQLIYQKNQGQLLFFYINTVVFHENSTILMNFTQQGLRYPEDWPFYIVGAMVQVFGHSTVTIVNSVGRKCGGMVLERTSISFQGESKWLFSNNIGRRGGAMVFKKRSTLSASVSIITMAFINNHARVEGGAIFVEDSDYIIKGSYLGDDEYKSFTEGANIDFYFENNTAGKAGSAIYGGWIDLSQSKFMFGNQVSTDLSLVSSNPTRLCFCSRSLPSCNRTVYSVELIPGQTFSVGIVAVGQRNGVVPASVLANLLGTTSAYLEPLQYTQRVGTKCTNLVYTVRSTHKTETMKLTVASTNSFVALQHDKNIDTDLSINIHLKNCSLGFYLDSKLMECQCQQILINHNIRCNLTTFKILRESPKWMNATFIHRNSSDTSGVIVHDHCPFDYCQQTEGYSELNLTNPDEQCSSNRSGILCGACQTNFSRVLGTSKCKLCSKHWIALMIPLIAIAGVALVVVLIILNLTVSVGTINGLIFYANILRANHAIFFQYETSNSFLSTFIAWLNLDLGIEICFYDDLDAFTITWLQFLFPTYIWLIVLIIIVGSHYSTRVSKVCGSNAVQVLATLFLLSYAKLLRIIITVFSSTTLVFPDGHDRKVWLYDGNTDYLKGKHIYLFAVAIALLIFISLPYTAILLFVQLLQRFSNCKMLFWVVKLHPLFDAYTGPYRNKHRYWTGLLLLLRACLFLTFSLNVLGDPKINLLAILLAALSLCAYNSIIGGVYKNWLVNLIEVAFVFNLGILSAIAHYQISSGTSITPVTYISAGIALAFSVVIMLYHVKMRITSFKWGKALNSRLHRFISHKNPTTKTVNIDNNTEVTSSSVELRELLLSV